ncbi:Gfo/Idh/MocA family protein [Mucilaginibacter xinganensis]|uniref:Oxidoreductase n=1 Tax=Mucilaginibacter xinganensis TaxID=1234841 RepID=A0A223NU31_9SPHI|nr:Gfo/Idh/MocA family oxidoreductase [Mucilaginibacter xinganensis]ASU33270.1 oxidoreductase [Mucilaginibacter xinganensis]
MKEKEEPSRRSFLRKLGTATAAVAVGQSVFAAEKKNDVFAYLKRPAGISVNDQINIALIGAGGQGSEDTNVALQIPGVKLIAVCDLYDGRLADAKKRWGADIFTTKIYKEVLNRKDIDAVIIGTPDHWHEQISVDAMHAGKHVYCEKPMVHAITEGPAVIQAQKETGKIFQVGSQGVSSLGNEKARELLAAGAIGQLNYAEGFWARRGPVEVWQYPIPADASPRTVDWDTYVSNTHKRPFDEKRFFRWRNYTDYGTGMAGDLFVHLFSSLHFVTGSHGPEKIYASGGLRFWNDGREVPDVLLGTFDYAKNAMHPAFNLSLRCNFVDGTSGTTYLRLVGSEGAMDVTWDKVVLKRNKVFASDDPFYLEKLRQSGDRNPERKKMMPPEEIAYEADKGYLGGSYDHMNNFITAIRTNGKVTEDATFGYRAAAPALLCNDSYFKNQPMFWDPEKMIKKV